MIEHEYFMLFLRTVRFPRTKRPEVKDSMERKVVVYTWYMKNNLLFKSGGKIRVEKYQLEIQKREAENERRGS